MKKQLLTIVLLLFAAVGFSQVLNQGFSIDNINYKVTSVGPNTVEVIDSPNATGEVVIPATVTDGTFTYDVTSIGESAFTDNTRLTSVFIGNNVTTIGEGAFYMSSLESVVIGYNVTTIEGLAFAESSLTRLVFLGLTPPSLSFIKTIERENIDLFIPVGTMSAYDEYGWVFNLKSVTEMLQEFTIDNVVYKVTIGNTVTIIDSPNATGDVVIPATVTDGTFTYHVTSIGSNAFSSNGLTSVVIPDGVTSIGDSAFADNALTLVLSHNLTPPSIEANTFTNRNNTDLFIPEDAKNDYEVAGWAVFKSVTQVLSREFTIDNIIYKVTGPNTVEIIDSPNATGSVVIPAMVTDGGFTYHVTSIGDSAFADNALTRVEIPDNLITIGDYAFHSSSLEYIVLHGITPPSFEANTFYEIPPSNGVVVGASVGAGDELIKYYYNINLFIPEGVDTKDDYEQAGWAGFKSVTQVNLQQVLGKEFAVTNIIYKVTSVGPNAVEIIGSPDATGDVVIPATVTDGALIYHVTAIGYKAFLDNALTRVEIGDHVTTIGKFAFQNNALTSIEIGDHVTTIGSFAFYNNALTSVEIGDHVSSIGVCAFSVNALTEVNIPDGVTTIGDYAFSDNALARVVSLGLTAPGIGLNTFGNRDSIDLFIPEGTIQAYEAADWTGFKSATQVVGQEFTIDNIIYKVTSISPNTVEVIDSPNATGDVVIPGSVTNGAFTYHVTTIGNSAFRDNALTSVAIPDGVTTIGKYAFYRNALTSVAIPDSVTIIGDFAFAYNDLTRVEIPDRVTTIGYYAFNSNALTHLDIGNNVKTIGAFAFYGNALTSVTIPDGVTTIGDVAFSGNDLLTHVNIGNNITTIRLAAFYNNALTRVDIGKNVRIIEDEAFSSNALALVVSQGLTPPFIEAKTFINRDSIDLFIPDGTMATYEAAGWTGFKSVTQVDFQQLPGQEFTVDNIIYKVTSVGPNTVEIIDSPNATGDVVIPATVTDGFLIYDVTTIGNSAFRENALTSVEIGENVTTIEDYAFTTNALTSVDIPNNVTTIGVGAFAGNGLTSVEIGDHVTTIRLGAFYQNALTSVNIPNNVTTIGDNAFSYNALTSVEIGENVTTIGNAAFYSNALTSVVSQGLIAPSISDFTFDYRENIDLFIPEGTKQAYEAAGWTGFKSVTEDAMLGVNAIGLKNSVLNDGQLSVVIKDASLDVNDIALSNEDVQLLITDNQLSVVTGTAKLKRYAIYSITGANVLNGIQNTVSIAHLPHGVYIAVLTLDSGVISKKFTK